jgi:uncharacterized protein (DUF1778 family)
MCCFSTVEFRDDVILAAKKQGLTLQEFILQAVRDKIREYRKARATIEGRRAIALQKFFSDKRLPPNTRKALEALLEPYMPRE